MPSLLAIIDLGGYPDFTALYRQAGFTPTVVDSMRKALVALKSDIPDVIVAEFNYQSDFRDRTSNLETLYAVLQRHPNIKLIVFYEAEYLHQFEKLRVRMPVFAAIPFPIDVAALEAALGMAMHDS
jgi:DNA-binding NtrC family response regulator